MLEKIKQLRSRLAEVAAEVEPLLADLEATRLAANKAYTHGLKFKMPAAEVEAILAGLSYSGEDKQRMREVVTVAEPLDVEIAVSELRQARQALTTAVEIVGRRLAAS